MSAYDRQGHFEWGLLDDAVFTVLIHAEDRCAHRLLTISPCLSEAKASLQPTRNRRASTPTQHPTVKSGGRQIDRQSVAQGGSVLLAERNLSGLRCTEEITACVEKAILENRTSTSHFDRSRRGGAVQRSYFRHSKNRRHTRSIFKYAHLGPERRNWPWGSHFQSRANTQFVLASLMLYEE